MPVMHGLPTSEVCWVQGVQNPPLPLAGALGHEAGRRLNGRDGNPVPRVKAWAAL